jgi:hypothetical protein
VGCVIGSRGEVPGERKPVVRGGGGGGGGDGDKKGKVSLFLTKHHTMMTYWRSGGIAPRFLDLGTRCR